MKTTTLLLCALSAQAFPAFKETLHFPKANAKEAIYGSPVKIGGEITAEVDAGGASATTKFGLASDFGTYGSVGLDLTFVAETMPCNVMSLDATVDATLTLELGKCHGGSVSGDKVSSDGFGTCNTGIQTRATFAAAKHG
jgi:hypothetical protein